jgi:murein DD-endopeptidase MepM/ murein hydrolase activator NlpD
VVQPGVDLYFESKRFPAVLGGVVKDVSRESGYGNYVVVESTDPMTGQKVDVLYGHLADGLGIRPGQRVEAGDIIGTQGGTGNVRSVDGTIASIDFLAPAPRGSKSMAPYAGFDNLRRYVVSQLQR